MKLDEVIKSLGETVKWQLLNDDIISANTNKKRGTITFQTESGICSNLIKTSATDSPSDFIGVLIWVPRGKWPKPEANKVNEGKP
jgi:hypothetical protein